MLSLHELQKQFSELMVESTSNSPAMHDHPALNVQSPRARIYRNSIAETMRGALAATYPVIARLVGEDYFRSLALRYLRAHPSSSANIQDFGASLADFLDTLPELSDLPYLGDVARVEWLIQESCRAADDVPADITALGCLAPETYSDLRFSLQPSVRLFCSSYPVLHIWRSNQHAPECQETVSLDEGGDLLLIVRRGGEIEIENLGAGEFTMLCQLQQGHSLECAVKKALAADSQLDLAKILSRHLAHGTLVIERPNECSLATQFDDDITWRLQLGFSA